MRHRARSIRFPHAHHIRPLLGLNPGKLPANPTERLYELGGLRFRLLPARTSPVLRSRPHRLEVECNVCQHWMSVGRFNQHQGIHPRETLSLFSRVWLEADRAPINYDQILATFAATLKEQSK